MEALRLFAIAACDRLPRMLERREPRERRAPVEMGSEFALGKDGALC